MGEACRGKITEAIAFLGVLATGATLYIYAHWIAISL
jgi:hypothetical protein